MGQSNVLKFPLIQQIQNNNETKTVNNANNTIVQSKEAENIIIQSPEKIIIPQLFNNKKENKNKDKDYKEFNIDSISLGGYHSVIAISRNFILGKFDELYQIIVGDKKYPSSGIIGEGAEGVIYLVKEKKSQKIYAIKKLINVNQFYEEEEGLKQQNDIVLNKHCFTYSECVTILKNYDSIQELQTDSVLKYKKIFFEKVENFNYVDYYHCFIVMKLYEKTFKTFIDEKYYEKEKMKNSELINFCFEICDALDKIHAAGFIHRDLKPQNILLSKSNKFVLCDFGRVKLISESKTITGTIG
jgi:serine/threonine protein kinase